LNPEIFGPEAGERDRLEKGRVDKPAYQKALAHQLHILACSGDENAPYVLRGLIGNANSFRSALDLLNARPGFKSNRVMDAGPFALGFIESILKPGCPVFAALTEQEKAFLKSWAAMLKSGEAKETQPSESKQ
jgi:hypothetical protein